MTSGTAVTHARRGGRVLLVGGLLAAAVLDLAVGPLDPRADGLGTEPVGAAVSAPAPAPSTSIGAAPRAFALDLAGSTPPAGEPAAPSGPPEPAALVADGTALTDGPVPVPLELSVPTLGLRSPVLGVGMTDEAAMDAPTGPPGDPVWQQTFWYRGSAVPGAASTALLAGHVGSAGGRPGVFAHLEELRVGDPVEVLDTRTGLVVRFVVDEVVSYSLAEAARPDVLARIYGTGPIAGVPPQPSADGAAHLTLITCAGTYRGDTHDRRLVVYATRVR